MTGNLIQKREKTRLLRASIDLTVNCSVVSQVKESHTTDNIEHFLFLRDKDNASGK